MGGVSSPQRTNKTLCAKDEDSFTGVLLTGMFTLA